VSEAETPTRAADRESAEPPDPDVVERRVADALERVAHGATVSVPAILAQRTLLLAFTAVLTNGVSPALYGLFALARRLQRILQGLTLGFKSGLSRFLPTAESAAERDALATFASALMVAVAAVFGAALYVAAPGVTAVAGEDLLFTRLLRVFAVGLPATIWLFAVTEILRGIEAVGPLNLTVRIGSPLLQLVVAVLGVVLVGDLVVVAVGVVLAMGLTGTVAAAWLVRERGFRPRLRGSQVRTLAERYLRYTAPLFLGGFATVAQRFGFYPLIVVFLTSVAGGVFAIGVLVGSLVRLPLMGINQFAPPVAAALHEQGHRAALKRFYHVTSRLVLVGVTALAVPTVVFREAVLGLFGPTYVQYAPLLPGFVVAQYGACAAGSVGILLAMTDNQRALLIVNVAITAVLAVTAVPLVVEFGLPGLVVGYVLMLTINNGLEVAVLYRLEGLQPFTRRHAIPLVGAVPLAAVALTARALVGGLPGAAIGSLAGVAAYALTLRWIGFTPVERQLGATLADRYRERLARSPSANG